MNNKRTLKRFDEILEHSPVRIFPLLCPKKEYEWIEPWRCEMVFSKTGFAEEDCIFTTDYDEDGDVDVWVTTKYEKNKAIEFIRVNPLRVIKYGFTLEDIGNNSTHLGVYQQITSLCPEGDRFVDDFSDQDFYDEMDTIFHLLDYYLRTGKMKKIM